MGINRSLVKLFIIILSFLIIPQCFSLDKQAIQDAFTGEILYFNLPKNSIFGAGKQEIIAIDFSCPCISLVNESKLSNKNYFNFKYNVPQRAGKYKYKLFFHYKLKNNKLPQRKDVVLTSIVKERILSSPSKIYFTKGNRKNFQTIDLQSVDEATFDILDVSSNFGKLKAIFCKKKSAKHSIKIKIEDKIIPVAVPQINITIDHPKVSKVVIPCCDKINVKIKPSQLVFNGVEFNKKYSIKIINKNSLDDKIDLIDSKNSLFKLSSKDNTYWVSLILPKSYHEDTYKGFLRLKVNNSFFNLPYIIFPLNKDKASEKKSKLQSPKDALLKKSAVNRIRQKGTLLVSSYRINLPYISHGKIFHIREKITNTGIEAYELKIYSSCSSCSKVKPSKDILQPGESCFLDFSAFQANPGNFSKTLWITERNKKFRQQKLIISGKVKREYDIYKRWQYKPEFEKITENLKPTQAEYLYIRIYGRNNYDTACVAKSAKIISQYFALEKYRFIQHKKGRFEAELILKLNFLPEKSKEYVDWIGINFANVLKLNEKVVFLKK